MAIHNLFSKRLKKLRGDFPDVYQYEEIPQGFRNQVVHIIQDTVGTGKFQQSIDIYKHINRVLSKEYGVISLKKNNYDGNDAAVLNFFLQTKDYEQCLDIIELFFEIIGNYIAKNYMYYQLSTGSKQNPYDAINELNERFKEWGIGYEFQNGELIRIDSQFIHSEAVKPVLVLLANEKYYEGVNQEFLKAHEHYRHKRYKECLVECCKAFESLMKAICEKRKWDYKPTDTASKLIKACFDNKLIPSYMDNQIASLKQILESGVPTIRNKQGGHGQGTEILEVPEHLASYCLHLTASNLLFLANCEKQLG
jgi:hypothetical protein